MENNIFINKFTQFDEDIDFNFISKLLDRNNFKSHVSSNWLAEYVFESVFQIKGVESDVTFNLNYLKFNNEFNKKNHKSSFDIFYSFVSGNKSITHRDDYDVYLLGLMGKTLYRIEGVDYILEKGDLLHVPKNKLHKAIGITPRIVLSYGIYN
jgi:hypothetical protein